MKIINIQNKVSIPESMLQHLSGMSIEEQLRYFSLESCFVKTYSITDRHVTPSDRVRGNSINMDKYPILVQDGIVVGIDIGEELDCIKHRYSKVISFNGHRTSSDYWYYEEDLQWYVFRYLGK